MRLLPVCFAALLLAACGADQPVNPPTDTAAAPAPSAAPAKPTPATRPAAPKDTTIDAAIAAIVPPDVGTVRYDRLRVAETGKQERQVFVEILGQSAEAIEGMAVAHLTAAGFEVVRRFNDENGFRVTLTKKGHQPVRLLLRDKAAGPALNDPAATSSLYFRQVAL